MTEISYPLSDKLKAEGDIIPDLILEASHLYNGKFSDERRDTADVAVPLEDSEVAMLGVFRFVTFATGLKGPKELEPNHKLTHFRPFFEAAYTFDSFHKPSEDDICSLSFRIDYQPFSLPEKGTFYPDRDRERVEANLRPALFRLGLAGAGVKEYPNEIISGAFETVDETSDSGKVGLVLKVLGTSVATLHRVGLKKLTTKSSGKE